MFFVKIFCCLFVFLVSRAGFSEGIQPFLLNHSILLHSGEFLQKETDLKIPGRGLDFEFTRTYRSRIEYDGPLGHGWDHNYNKRLIVQEDGNIARFDGEARFDIYTKNPDGTYKSPPGYFDQLDIVVIEGEGANRRLVSGRITDKFGTIYTYLDGGWIKTLQDRNNNTMNFQWEGEGEAKRLVEVRDTLGRAVIYRYSDDHGKLTSITDWTGRVVQFGYDARCTAQDKSRCDLVSVTNPAGAAVHYAYTSGFGADRSELNHNLTRITDAKNQPYLENTYSIYDRVVKQKFGHEGEFHMEYHQVASSQECTAELAGKIFYRTRLRDRVGNLVDYSFNCQGNPLSVVKQTRGVRARGAGGGAGAEAGGADPAAAGDPASFVTKYCYDGQGLLTRLVQPKGNAIEYGYDAKGNMLVMRKHESAPEKCSDAFAGGGHPITTIYTYDEGFSQLASVTDAENRTTTFAIDPDKGNITQKCLPPIDGAERICENYSYNEQGQIVSMTDGAGNVDAYNYNDNGYLERITRGVGDGKPNLINEFGYDGVGNIISFTDGRGNIFNFRVDALNRVTREESPPPQENEARVIREFEYDANNNVIHISGNGAVETEFEYDILDRVATKTEMDRSGAGEPRRLLTEYQYDLNENLIRVIEPEGNSTFIEYDERDLPYRVTKGYRSDEAATSTYDYDLNGNVARVVDGRGNAVRYEYDGHDRLLTIADPLGNEMHLEHDDVGNIQAISRRGPPAGDANAAPAELARTEFIYDALNRLVRRTEKNDPADSISRYIYDKAHRLIWFFNANNQATRFEYDEAGRLVYRRDALGNIERFRYDGNGNLLTAASSEVGVDANGAPDPNVREIFTDTFFYDALNRPLSRTDNAGNVTAYHYDDRNNLISTTDPEGSTLRYCYDALNRLTAEVKGLRQEVGDCNNVPAEAVRTRYGYDDNGRLTQIIDAKDHTTAFGFDALNRQVRVELQGGATYTKNYDHNGNLIEETQPNGYVVRSEYDAANRLREKIIHKTGAADERETFTYDGLSRMLTAGNFAGSVEFAYDKLSHVISEAQRWGEDRHVVSKDYDPMGNVIGRTYPSERRIRYGYDALNRLGRVEDLGQCEGMLCVVGIGNPDPVPLLTTTYRGRDRLDEQELGNQTRATFRYDHLNRIGEMRAFDPQDNVIVGFAYGYDKVGNRLTEQHLHDGDRGNVFEYDNLYRLIRAKSDVANPLAELRQPGSQPYVELNEWRLDPVDNWESRLRDQTPAVAGNEWVQRFVSNDVNAYISVDGTAYRYDESGNLIEDGEKRYEYNYRNLLTRVVNKADGAPDAEVAAYGYDALGRRISKTVVGEGGGAPVTTHYIYDGVHVVAELAQDGITQREFVYGDSIDDPVAMVTRQNEEDVYHYYHADAQGSVVALTNAGGQVEERYTYDPYGVASVDIGGGISDESAVGNPYLYTGQRLDPETGFYYYKARYYHPTLGRFLQRDPLGYVDGYNLYAYTANNPINFVDPLGLNSKDTNGRASAGNPNNFDINGDGPWVDQTNLKSDNSLLNQIYRGINNTTGFGAKIGNTYLNMISKAGEFLVPTQEEAVLMMTMPVAGATEFGAMRASRLGGRLVSIAEKTGGFLQKLSNKGVPEKLYHYGFSRNSESILRDGLRAGRDGKIFTTAAGDLSPLQAQIDLALSPNQGLRDALFEIDTRILRQKGIAIPNVQRVGRSSNMPGGGTEVIFDLRNIPAEAIKRVW